MPNTDEAEERTEIDQTTTIDHSVEDTWHLVTDPDALGRWLGGRVEMTPEEGSPFVFRTGDRIQRGEVIEVIPDRQISWVWRDGADESLVTITVDGNESRSTVRVTERLLPPSAWSQPSIPPVVAAVA